MEFPYNKVELQIALVGIGKKISTKKFNKVMSEIKAELEEKLPSDKNGTYAIVAKQNGVSTETIINSPNLELILSQYKDELIRQLIQKLYEKANFSIKEAHAFVACALGLLD